MKKIRLLVLWLAILGPLHLAEQLLTKMEDFYNIQQHLKTYYGWFEPASSDTATAILIMVAGTIFLMLVYALLREGAPRLFVTALLGLFGAQAIHHVFEAIMKGEYNPGLVTSIPYLIVGNLLVSASWHEYRRGRAQARAVEASRAVATVPTA